MILLDTSALLTFLLGESGESEVASLLRSGECAIPAPCLAESIDRLIRKQGTSSDAIPEHLGPLVEESVSVLVIDTQVAWRAGEIRAAHYHRKAAALSLADCLVLASAAPEDRIATSDAALAATADTLDLTVIPLPDSTGHHPNI
ncbi:MAG TPA: PIN domain-containing protein [Solirubrobacterales bacterium]